MPTERAPAKINLALHIRAKRPDGYHDLETLYAFATDGDLVTVEPSDRDSLTINGPFAATLNPTTTTDADNLVTRAAAAFTTAFAVQSKHAITLTKNLPIASGIGGGSADAAATLRALAILQDIAIDGPELLAIAAQLGADVPACLIGRPTRGTGKGDTLIPIDAPTGLPLLLVNPRSAVSTPAVFANWNGIDLGPLGQGDTLSIARAGRNDLEAPAMTLAPAIADVRAFLDAQANIVLSRMSGSGATCFALFKHGTDLTPIAETARAKGWWVLSTSLS